MATHNDTGRNAEKQAVEYLKGTGHEILETNFRYKRNEIDIIAQKEGLLVFIEVKARGDVSYGFPEDSVDDQKIERIHEAAEEYIETREWKGGIRFDIISIIATSTGDDALSHFEDAF